MRRKRPAKRRPVIDKSQLKFGEPERKHDEKYRRWIAKLPCCVTRLSHGIQCAHIRKSGGAGMSQKPSDVGNCVPLHWEKHDLQHRTGEKSFWDQYGGLELVRRLAEDLGAIYRRGGDKSEAVFRIMAFQRGL